MDYELALKGLNDIEKYVEQIDRIVSEHVETELTQDEDGFGVYKPFVCGMVGL